MALKNYGIDKINQDFKRGSRIALRELVIFKGNFGSFRSTFENFLITRSQWGKSITIRDLISHLEFYANDPKNPVPQQFQRI